jgi:branched-subunit amino acid transport protein
MSATWLIVLTVGIATVALKGLAPVLLGARELPGTVARVNGALAPALLAALVTVQTVGDGAALTIDPRVAGVAAAAVALLLRAPLLVVLISSAGVAAAVNALA